MSPSFRKGFKIIGDEIINLSTEKNNTKKQKGESGEKLLGKTRTKQLRSLDNEKRATFLINKCRKYSAKSQNEKEWVIKVMNNLVEVKFSMMFPKKINYKVKTMTNSKNQCMI